MIRRNKLCSRETRAVQRRDSSSGGATFQPQKKAATRRNARRTQVISCSCYLRPCRAKTFTVKLQGARHTNNALEGGDGLKAPLVAKNRSVVRIAAREVSVVVIPHVASAVCGPVQRVVMQQHDDVVLRQMQIGLDTCESSDLMFGMPRRTQVISCLCYLRPCRVKTFTVKLQGARHTVDASVNRCLKRNQRIFWIDLWDAAMPNDERHQRPAGRDSYTGSGGRRQECKRPHFVRGTTTAECGNGPVGGAGPGHGSAR